MTLTAAQAKYPGAIGFTYGDSAKLNAEILTLVRSGQKTVTCDALAGYEARSEPPPKVGRVDIALDWAGVPQLAVRTVHVQVVGFDRMPEALVADQGEFRDLDHWQQAYRAYLTRAGLFAQDADMLVERFELLEDFAAGQQRSLVV